MGFHFAVVRVGHTILSSSQMISAIERNIPLAHDGTTSHCLRIGVIPTPPTTCIRANIFFPSCPMKCCSHQLRLVLLGITRDFAFLLDRSSSFSRS